MDMSKRGFTLVEVLCVIAIIAVLAMILFPVFAHAREKARQTACLNNQKQVALAFTIWAQDHDESFPGGENWAAALTLPPKSSLICLTQGRARSGGNSYGYNTYVADSTLGEFDQPQTTVLTADCSPSNTDRLLRTGADYDARHNGKVICGFVDGHAVLQDPPIDLTTGWLEGTPYYVGTWQDRAVGATYLISGSRKYIGDRVWTDFPDPRATEIGIWLNFAPATPDLSGAVALTHPLVPVPKLPVGSWTLSCYFGSHAGYGTAKVDHCALRILDENDNELVAIDQYVFGSLTVPPGYFETPSISIGGIDRTWELGIPTFEQAWSAEKLVANHFQNGGYGPQYFSCQKGPDIVSYINNIALNRMTIHGTGTGIIVKLRDHVYKLPAPPTWNRPAKLQAWSSIKTPGDVTMINPNFSWE